MSFQQLNRPLIPVVLVITLLTTPALSCPQSCNCYSTKVDCSGLRLAQIPQGVPTTTTHLYLRNNDINNIKVGDFAGLTALQELDLSDNLLRNITHGVLGGLANLQTLRLRGNFINNIAAGAFTGLSSLKTLILSKNSISSVSSGDFGTLSTLENLHLDNNDISAIASSAFTGLTNLKLLDLSKNAMNDVPTGTFYGIPFLQSLNLHNNNISTFSSGSLSGLSSILTLDLSNNSIAAIVTGTFGFSPNLTELNLNSNVITSLQANAFEGAKSMKHLRLRNNAINTIDRNAFSGMLRVDSVDLQNNDLTSIEDGDFIGLRFATTLNLADNSVTSLPAWGFRGAEDLVNLDLRNNRVSSFHGDALRGLPRLETLDISHNAIDAVTDGTFAHIQSVLSLNLGGNNITSIPRDAFQRLGNLKNLTLSRNGINDVQPGAFNGLRDLESLDLSHNQIGGVPGMMFAQLPSLQVLHLQNNPWNCICKLLDLVRWIQVTSVNLWNSNDTVCAPAGPFTGLYTWPLANVHQELEMMCAPRTSPRPVPVSSTSTTSPRRTTSTKRASPATMTVPRSESTKSTSRVPATTTDDDDDYTSTSTSTSRSAPPPPPPQGLSNTAVIVIAVVVSLAVVTVAACVLGFLWAKKKRREALEVRRGAADGLDNHYMDLSALPASEKFGRAPAVPVRPQFMKYELDRKDLELGAEIGRGAFGVVYLATRHKNDNGFPTEETVVVKTVHAHAMAEARVTFVREIETTLDLGKHPNLLGLVGCCTTSHPPYMVTEYMPYGDLKEFLLKCRKTDEKLKDSTYDLEDLNKYQIARQIANGMIFISQAGYVHGDLAARNVLVGEDLVVKIADFGLATDVYERGYQRQDAEQKIPVRWMAPERLLREGRYTSKSDVWSFGVVLYEIATLGNVPYPGLDRQLMDELRGGYREPRPDNCPQEMYSLMLQCWQWEEDDRPEFQQLYDELDRLMTDCCEVNYLEPFGDPAEAEAAGASGGVPKEANDASARDKSQDASSLSSKASAEPGQDSMSKKEASSSTQKETISEIP
ncbi:uncharacterized protein [Branchiostoma lanceolatum]|uniref:uncharacterized protein n=1 Tax=Branchiostoma lanceolatum TaxID=7740 RepID=UPI003451702D